MVALDENVMLAESAVGLTGGRWWLATGLVLVIALLATLPTTGDIGLTWDEPAYRYSQVVSAHWWERLGRARSWADVAPLLEPDALLYYWPYGRHGINFHPPLAGQLNLATHALFGRWMKDIPSRRLASVFEYALTLTILFGFLARRYGAWVGAIAAGALLVMPRVYGDGHIAGTDTPGLLLWGATAIACWKGLHEPDARRWRVLVGILLGLAFIEKMSAVFVLLPLVAWLVLGHLSRSFWSRDRLQDWIDGVVTTAAMLLPLAIAYNEIHRLTNHLPIPKQTNLFLHRPQSQLPGLILAVPLFVWLVRRVLGRLFPASLIWGPERPALETWTAILAFAPVIGWLGNPAWWRETLPRLAHYYLLNTDRQGSLPDIQILYLGQTYEYSLPWHNAWVLIAITVPVAILAAAVAGIAFGLCQIKRDRLPLFFLVNLLTHPVFRMLPTPAHDGVRLFLPTFFFLAAFAGWGTVWVADGLARLTRARRVWTHVLLAGVVLIPSAWQLVKVHPYELSYYNELIGGSRRAWHEGFELAYWYDAFNDQALADLNARLPRNAAVDFVNVMTQPPTFAEHQALGHLRGDIVLGIPDVNTFPHAWVLTQDSKAVSFTRLLFEMTPFYAVEPRGLDGARVAAVIDPVGVSRAWALNLLASDAGTNPPRKGQAPEWVRRYVPWIGRFWGEGLKRVRRLKVYEPAFEWARKDPDGFRAAARLVVAGHLDENDAGRLMRILVRFDQSEEPGGLLADRLLRGRPQALIEAVDILIDRPDDVRKVLTRYPYTDPAEIGGYLDRDLVVKQR